MESQGNFDFKSDLDFPTLGSDANSSRNSSPPQKNKAKEDVNKDSRENSRSMSRGRGKKQNWKAVQIEFNNNAERQRYPPRGSSRPRFGHNHAISRSTDEPPVEMGYRSYRSRNRRARGGFAPNHYGRPHSTESMTPPEMPLEPPTIMAIPYTPNYATYVQPLATAIPTEPVEIDIKDIIRRQIEYYFSDDNLIKDNFMRTNMTKEGFLSIKLIANFNKIRQMNVDIETITQAIETSDKLDVVDREIVRPVINPLRWPLSQPLPEFQNLVKNFGHYDPLVASMQPNIPLELNPVEPVIENLPEAPVPQMVYSDAEPSSPDSVNDITNYIENLTFDDAAAYGYDLCYPTDPQDSLEIRSCQQDSQDVNSFQHMLTYVSS